MSKNCKILIVLIPILVGLSIFISCYPEKIFSYDIRYTYQWAFGDNESRVCWEGNIALWKQGVKKNHVISNGTGCYELGCAIVSADTKSGELKNIHQCEGEFIISVKDCSGNILLEKNMIKIIFFKPVVQKISREYHFLS